MAARSVTLGQVSAADAFGWSALVFVVSLVFLPLGAVFWFANTQSVPGSADWAAVRFTVLQAVISAALSIMLAVPMARALARRDFLGRGLLLTLLGAPFILPVIVAVLGLLAVFGRSGLVNQVLEWFSLPPIQIYGFHGVIIAHVFFNLPLATRLLLQGWQSIPAEHFRLSASLNLGTREVFRFLEWPMLRATLPGIAVVIFAICLSSFAVALILGGGPRATTVELAIYQAFRFDFDLGRAAMLAMIQMALVTLAAVFALRLGISDGFGRGMDRPSRRWEAETWALRLIDGCVLVLIGSFLILPMGAVILRGLEGLTHLPSSVWQAAQVSLLIALVSTAVTIMLSLSLAQLSLKSPKIEVIGLVGIAMSPLVIGTGLFLLIHPIGNPDRWTYAVTIMVNALAALPFTLRVLVPSLRKVERDFGALADGLGMTGLARLRWLVLPRLRRPLGFSAGLAAALSFGDLGVIALFAGPDRATLPLEIFRLMGAYRMDAAAGASLVLLAMTLGVFWVFDQGGKRDVDA
jgi:thiamine transport system permease protein